MQTIPLWIKYYILIFLLFNYLFHTIFFISTHVLEKKHCILFIKSIVFIARKSGNVDHVSHSVNTTLV